MWQLNASDLLDSVMEDYCAAARSQTLGDGVPQKIDNLLGCTMADLWWWVMRGARVCDVPRSADRPDPFMSTV